MSELKPSKKNVSPCFYVFNPLLNDFDKVYFFN